MPATAPPLFSATALPAVAIEIATVSPTVQFATLTRRGVAVVDAVLPVPGTDGRTVDIGTGLAYPGKADRARRNPRVGLLFSGAPGDPVLVIGARAAVQDSDLQANTDRWVDAYRSTWMAPDTLGKRWEQAVCYFVRVFVSCAPASASWWPDGDLSREPATWSAPADTVFAASDPEPAGERTVGPAQPTPDWQAEADRILDLRLPPPVLTRVGPDGYPLPFPTTGAIRADSGFALDVSARCPWPATGPATLSFEAPGANPPGIGGAFVGDLEDGRFRVERMLPPNYRAVAYREDPSSHLFQPAEIHDFLMSRLRTELDRRGAPVPVIRGLDVESDRGRGRRGRTGAVLSDKTR